MIDYKVADPTDRKLLHKITSQVARLADTRHRVIHDHMATLTVMQQKISLARKEEMFRKTQIRTDITVASLKLLGDQMTDLSFRLQRYTKNDPQWRSGAQFPWRDKPQKRSRQRNPRQPSEQ
jgi:3-deoxy-D-manno-octulosonate 8-phosphate phosphatase KdsC-like HAD superfamily phosphatase